MKPITLLLILSLLPHVLAAQSTGNTNKTNSISEQSQPNFENFLNKKCEAVVHEMGLSKEDSEKFLPIYRELQTEKRQLFNRYGDAHRKVRKSIKEGQEVSDTTLLRVVNNTAALHVEDAALERKYLSRLSSVLTPLQLFLFQQAEQKFKTSILQQTKLHKK